MEGPAVLLPQMATSSNGAQSPSRSATRVLDLLDALQDAPGGLPLHELARRTGMPKNSAMRYLGTLAERRYVERDPLNGEYRLGLAVPSQAQFYGRLASAARPVLQRIAERFDETVTFGVLDRDRVSFLDVVQSTQAIRLAAHVGDRDLLHCTAAGKAVASTLPEEVVRKLLATSGMPAQTPKTIVDIELLLAELHEVRERGYAIADLENDPGARGVAVPLPTPRVHGALGVTAPAMRFSLRDAERVAEVLREEARDIAASFERHDGTGA